MESSNTMARDGFSSELQRKRRTAGYDKIREATGKPAPTAHQRKLRRERNQRYRAGKEQARTQEKAA